jgi:hypothetical protein
MAIGAQMLQQPSIVRLAVGHRAKAGIELRTNRRFS